jgi:hypothetical protein
MSEQYYTIKKIDDSETWAVFGGYEQIGVAADKHEAEYWRKYISTHTAKFAGEIDRLQKEIASLQEAAATHLATIEAQSETIGRRTNALRRISEILQDNDASSRTKLGSIGFVVKEALKALSLFDWSEASNEETQQAEQLALGLEAPDSAKGSGE